MPKRKTGRNRIGDGSSAVKWVKMYVEPDQSGSDRACLLAKRAAWMKSGNCGTHRTAGSTAGVLLGTPSSTLAMSSAITTLPVASTATNGSDE